MSISAESLRFDDDSMWVELSDGRTLGGIMKHLDARVEWLGIVQAVLGAVLLFLFGLACAIFFA